MLQHLSVVANEKCVRHVREFLAVSMGQFERRCYRVRNDVVHKWSA